jgi:hypothetical protein
MVSLKGMGKHCGEVHSILSTESFVSMITGLATIKSSSIYNMYDLET